MKIFVLAQDNYFAHHVGPIGLYGVCDGHGPFGHLVSFRLVSWMSGRHEKTKTARLVNF